MLVLLKNHSITKLVLIFDAGLLVGNTTIVGKVGGIYGLARGEINVRKRQSALAKTS